MKKIKTFYDFIEGIDLILNNTIIGIEADNWFAEYHPQDESGESCDIYQGYIIDERDALYLLELAEENKYGSYAIYHNELLDMGLIGVSHFGTAGSGVKMY